MKNNDTILRVLQSHDDKALVIDCVKRTMPKWVEKTFLSDYVDCCDAEMYECTDYPAGRTLTQEEQRIAQEHYRNDLYKIKQRRAMGRLMNAVKSR